MSATDEPLRWVCERRFRRLSSNALLNLGVPVDMLVMWPAMGKGAGLNAETDALAAAITEHGIRPTDVVNWVDGRDGTVGVCHCS